MALGKRVGKGARKLAGTVKRKIKKDVQKAKTTIEKVQRAGTRRRLGTAAPTKAAARSSDPGSVVRRGEFTRTIRTALKRRGRRR